MCSDFVLIKYDDGDFHCTKKSNIKASSMGGHVVKWKSTWYGTKILCTGSKELCQSLYLSIKLNLPRVEIKDILDHNSTVWYKWDDIGHSENKYGNSFELPMVEDVFIDSNLNYQSCDGILNTSFKSTNLTDTDIQYVYSDMNSNQSVSQLYENDSFHNSVADPDYEVESSISSNSDSEEDRFERRKIIFNKKSSPLKSSEILINKLRKNDDSIKKQLPVENDAEFDNSGADIDFEIEPSCSSISVSNKDRLKMNLNKNSTPQMASNFFLKAVDNPVPKSSPNSVLMVDSNSFSPVVINEITPSATGKSKRYFCLFCKTLVTKFGRHILLHHEDESPVKKIGILPKGSKECHKLIGILRKKGTFLFNTRNQYNDGHLIVCRQPHIFQGKKENDYKPCPSCKDFYSKSAIRRHYKKCYLKAETGKKNLMPLSRAVQGHIHKKANIILRSQIFPRMREDCHTDIVRYDELAIVYGNYLTNKYRKPHLHTMIRSKLRLIGRLLNAIKNINKTITDFSSIFQPKYYDEVIAAVNKVAILGENNSYHSPATAFSYGTLLKKCAKLLINECIKQEDEEKLKKCRNFQSIIEEDFASSVNKTVEENQKEMRRHKKVNLPTMDDVRKLKKYLDSNRNKCFDFLSNEAFDFGIWTQLSECTLTSVQMFNRRRAGEIERITIEDFRSYETINENVDSDIFNSLSEENKKLAKQYVRFEIRGKLGRPVPVLLHLSLVSCIELILNKREEANVSSENPHVFGMPGGKEKYLKACTLLRKFSNFCGAQHPQTLRGTELRKHIATYCVLLNLQEEEVDDLANFLGHANKIHKEHYRMPIVTRDIVRMSRLLEKAQGECNIGELSNVDSSVVADISANMNHAHQISPNGIHSSPSIDKNNCRPKRSVSPTGRVKRVSWSEEEKQVALDLFASHIQNRNLPSTNFCFETIKENPVLRNRSPLQLKSWLSNQLMRKKTSIKRRRVSTLYWSNDEKQLMTKLFSDHLKSKTLPSFTECLQAIANNSILKYRSKETIKAWVFNQNRK